MKILAAPNALKGSLSAFDAASAIAAGARRARPDVDVRELAIADGGDGTAEVVLRARGGAFRALGVLDPLGREREGRYAWLGDGTAVVDAATASGLALLKPHERDAGRATSFGTGQLLRAALEAGAKRVVLGVGGSATVDGGAGVLKALGARLLDEAGRELPHGGAALAHLSRIDASGLLPAVRDASLTVACDVDSPLVGEHGAARFFAPQKGASSAEVAELERALTHFASIVARDFGRDVAALPRAGAAGGLAAGLHGVLGAALVPGIDWVLDTLGFDDALAGATLCLTAEGQLDRQSLRRKGPLGVAERATARGVPVVALVGALADGCSARDFPLFSGIFSLCSRPMTTEESMRDARHLLAAAAEQCVRLFSAATASR
jgi:glycerate 2-kinase